MHRPDTAEAGFIHQRTPRFDDEVGNRAFIAGKT
jgi:hypothetical protein